MTFAELIESINKLPTRREKLGRDFGPFDCAQAIMEFREGGV